ncbi:MAG: trimethylamine methyltransferase family protein [Anaerolineae bacterium]
MKQIRSCVEVLSRAELERIHQASLEILRDVGVRVPHETLLTRLRAAGAVVEGDVAKLPEALVSRVLADIHARRKGKRVSRWARNSGNVRVSNGNEMMLLEYPEMRRRPGTLEDVRKGILLTNALPTVREALPVVVPSDVPLAMAEIESYRLGCLYSTKPFSVYLGIKSCPYLMEMADTMAAATGMPHREVGFGFGFGIVSPLRFAEEDLACAMMTSSRGYPTGCFSFVVVGASGPASMAGTLALSNAERLACLTVMWAWGEFGHREGFVDDPCIIEPSTLATSFGHPNLTTLAVANSQLSRFYGLGSGGGGLALSDAKTLDFQSGFERGMGAVFCILSGGGIGNSGIVGPDEAMSFEQLVADDAWLSAINWISQGIEVTDESLGLDVIKEVGIGGTYLDQEHTVRHLRQEYWRSPLFTRRAWADWEDRGSDTWLERAHCEVERILAEGSPPRPVVSEAVVAQLDEIVTRARAALVT